MEKYNDIQLKIANAILHFRKRSERFVGFIPYTLNFEIRKYNGTSQKPEDVTILDKTIVNLIGRGVNDVKEISRLLGFDYHYDLEKDILESNLDYCKSQLRIINRSKSILSLTPIGQKLYEEGEYIKKFSGTFELYVDPLHSYYTNLKECVSNIPSLKKDKKSDIIDSLSLQQIKSIAEEQASHMQRTEKGLELINAELTNATLAHIDIYLCFLQNIRDNSIRTIVYDDNTDSVLPLLSSLFDEDIVYRDSLLKQCLTNEEKENEITEISSGEKTEEQIAAEVKIIEEADEKGEEFIDEIEDRKIGSIYDSAEFERELNEIFESHHNEEIWLISPWIRKYAFIRNREPKIRKFLDQGGAIFIGYSEPEKLGEEMVDPDSMAMVKSLDARYDKFYYAELPKFHFKNVIEHSNNKTTLYTGSFNVLSFCINENERHYRMEQMMLANEESANQSRADYLSLFAKQYIAKYMVALNRVNKGETIKVPKLSYLDKCGALDEWYHNLSEVAEEKSVIIDMKSFYDFSKEDLILLAQKVIKQSYQEDKYYIQALLAADLYLFEEGKNSSDVKLRTIAENHLFQMLQRKSMYNICRFILSKGKEDIKKSIIRIVCNGINFEFGEISLPSNVFTVVNKHKEYFDMKTEKIKSAKKTIDHILYNSAKAIGLK